MSKVGREPGKGRSGNLRGGTSQSPIGYIFSLSSWSQNFRVVPQHLPWLESSLQHPHQVVTNHVLVHPQRRGAHYLSGNQHHLWTALVVRTFRFLSPHQPPKSFLEPSDQD